MHFGMRKQLCLLIVGVAAAFSAPGGGVCVVGLGHSDMIGRILISQILSEIELITKHMTGLLFTMEEVATFWNQQLVGLHACMCVCMCVFMYVCVNFICIYSSICTWLYVCKHG